MIEKFTKVGNWNLLKTAVEEGCNCSVFGLNIGEKLALLEDSAFLFYVVHSKDQSVEVINKLLDLGRSVEFLGEVITPLSSEFDSSDKILDILTKIKKGQIDTLVLTPEILAMKLPSPDVVTELSIKKSQELNISELVKKLINMGYSRVDLVDKKGEFSVRGDVLDIYPLSGNFTRIMTDFDVVESIRNYNPITLLSTGELEEVVINSNNFYNVTCGDVEKFYNENNLRKDDLFYDLTNFSNINYRLVAIDKNINSSIFDFVDGGVIAFDGAKNIYENLNNYIKSYNESLMQSSFKKILLKSTLDINQLLNFDKKFTLVAFHLIQQNNKLFKPEKVFSIRTLPSVNYSSHNNVLMLDLENYKRQNFTVILCVSSNEQAIKIQKLLESNRLSSNIFPRISLCQSGSINIVVKKYPLNIILLEEKLVVISYTSLFGQTKKIKECSTFSFFDGDIPSEGDFVVHNFHGVGKCLGVKTMNISDSQRDYVVIEYKNNDKVYIPVENLDQVSKYLGSDKTPQINKIGGIDFAKTKEKVKTAVKKIAFDLIALYRERLNLKGYKYSEDDQMQYDFENSFGFEETVDQLKAINDCKIDMQSGKVMDRLVCGDVGFGKTEVALRIAFKTILEGKQVVFLCPTTILSEQHFNTAVARMSKFGVKVDVLNRLRSKYDENRIKKAFSEGKIDMLCGTHKLLSSDIDYKNLGLLVLDEEQKFGVADKEKIKNFKNHINVLTLSATPIPRTLNMSLIGVRDISVIETPPTQRISSEVQVVEYNENLIRAAIENELGRNGQVLVIYNRVEKIYNFASVIKNLVPSAVVSVAHGQMQQEELEREIFNLYSGKTQVLVATTLIENGVDLPNANTLIVINSDMLGLSQLYQLKGRIGRSDKTSFAYFTFDNRKTLTENAYKRLEAIKEFSEMGSGFKIAMRDLEIRGAGSLLGAEQSGHIEKIGYNMYVSILNESVKELKGEKVEHLSNIKIETSHSAYLSHDYINISAQRMAIYKQISSIDSVERLQKFINKIEESFGSPPEELINLCKIAIIKNILCRHGVEKVVIRKTCKIVFESKEYLNKKIIDLINTNDDITLNIETLPMLEIKLKPQVNPFDIVLEFVYKITD